MHVQTRDHLVAVRSLNDSEKKSALLGRYASRLDIFLKFIVMYLFNGTCFTKVARHEK